MIEKINLFCVELELAPYKIDLWNKIASSKKFNKDIFFTEEKNFEVDGFHDFKKFPKIIFNCRIEKGNNFFSKIRSLFYILKKILFNKNDYIYIAGFNHFVTFTTILICIIFNKKYLLNDDLIKFKNNSPFKNILKKIIYRK